MFSTRIDFRIGIVLMFVSISSFAIDVFDTADTPVSVVSTTLPVVNSIDWKLSIEAQSSIMQCTLQREPWDLLGTTDMQDGFCQLVDRAMQKDILSTQNTFVTTSYLLPYTGTFINDNFGSSFDLGGYAACGLDGVLPLSQTILGQYCKGEESPTLSPTLITAENSVDAEGIMGIGLANQSTIKSATQREFRAISGKSLYALHNDIEGGALIAEMVVDPLGSTATAMNSFDKATLILKELALKSSGDANTVIPLPKTKAQSIDLEDEMVNLLVRNHPDLYTFVNTLTRRLMNVITVPSKILEVAHNKGYKDAYGHSIGKISSLSLRQYEVIEQNLTAAFFRNEKAALVDIYKSIEYEAKAKYASEALLMSESDNYIMDPSEARVKYIKDTQKNAFRYAALLQQEKNKALKLRIALEIKRGKQRIDMAKDMAAIRASRFREDIAKHELDVLLSAVDETINYEED